MPSRGGQGSQSAQRSSNKPKLNHHHPGESNKRMTRSKTESSLSFKPSINQNQAVPKITKMLSQYEVLEILASKLGTEDLLHLAAANKEHWKYIVESETLYEKFKSSTICNGKGIRSRAYLFNHWNANPANATVKCKESDCAPCCKCGVQICETCRYHLAYFDDLECCEDDPDHQAHHEAETTSKAWLDGDFSFPGELSCWVTRPKVPPIETLKALRICGAARERRYCINCRPDPEFSALSLYMIEEDMAEPPINPFCRCNPICKFTHQLDWLCIPCFTLMETEANSRRLSRATYSHKKNTAPDAEFPIIRKYTGEEYLCDCGKPALPNDITECRWCRRYVEPDEFDDLDESPPVPDDMIYDSEVFESDPEGSDAEDSDE